MMFGWLAAAAALAASAQPGVVADVPRDQRIFTQSGYVGQSGTDGGLWFDLDHGEQRFRLPRAGFAEVQRYVDLLNAASERGFGISVRYNAAAGEAGTEGPYVTYPVCSLAVGDAEPLGDEAANCPPTAGVGDFPEERLALGLGIALEGPEAARALVGEALSSGRLWEHLRPLAFNVRGGAAERLARRHSPASAEHDRLSVEALADYRSWVAAAPDDSEARLAVARMLAALGGYDEAVAVLEALGRSLPDRAFEVAIRTGALYRQRGDFRRALRQLDDYVARHGVVEGMRYRYHRAWTLMMLGRDREALEEIGRGLEVQRDYSAAWLLQSCVRARLGSLAEALADQERGYALKMLLPNRGEPEVAEDIARSRAMIETLRAAVAAGRNRPVPEACEGFWDRWLQARPRSPLLDGVASGDRR